MKRLFVLAAALLLFALATLSTPNNSRTANAIPPDKCNKCMAKVQRDFERCEAESGGPTQACYDQFNLGVVDCYATVCEQ